MRHSFRVLTLVSILALPAVAQQPAAPADRVACAAEVAALESDVEAARAKGQMLRRQQLANQLATLRARCEQGASAPSQAARIDALEREIATLRAQLDHAEAELRKLKGEAH